MVFELYDVRVVWLTVLLSNNSGFLLSFDLRGAYCVVKLNEVLGNEIRKLYSREKGSFWDKKLKLNVFQFFQLPI